MLRLLNNCIYLTFLQENAQDFAIQLSTIYRMNFPVEFRSRGTLDNLPNILTGNWPDFVETWVAI